MPSRQEFEERYRHEMASKRQPDEMCRLMYVWNVADWHLLRNCHALDIEEWCVSMMFETFIDQYGTVEQKRNLWMLLSEVILEL